MKFSFINTNKSNLIITIFFCIFVFVPLILSFIFVDLETSLSEKRKLASFPKIPDKLMDIQKFPSKLESYYADHFGFRDHLVRLYKNFKYNIGDSPSENLTIGKNGWLFLGSANESYKKYGDPFGDIRGKNLYTENELKKFARNISNFNNWLKQRGIYYIFVIAPNKHTIYNDKLPKYIDFKIGDTATDQLVKYLNENTSVTVVDLRSSLLEGKKTSDVYSKTDTHWNHHGANIAQQEIFRVIDGFFPGEVDNNLLKIGYKDRSVKGDLEIIAGAKKMNLSGIEEKKIPYPIFPKGCKLTTEPKKFKRRDPNSYICNTKKLKALIFHDSFFSALKPYFIRQFFKSTYIWETASHDAVVKYIQDDPPEILIEEWVERLLPRPYPSDYSLSNSNVMLNPKDNYISDYEIIYSLEDGGLRFNQTIQLDNKESYLNLKATGNDPIIYFPNLDLKGDASYSLYLVLESDIKSNLSLYYSTDEKNKFPFNEKRSIKKPIMQGKNNLNIHFSDLAIGNRIRLDYLSSQGNVKIRKIELREY
jgi:alginate O-acetyltransferase complex protein AlgJ